MSRISMVLAGGLVALALSGGAAFAASCTANLTGLPTDTVCAATISSPPSSCKCKGADNGKFSVSGTLTLTDANCTVSDMIGCTIFVRCSSPKPASCPKNGKPTGGVRACKIDFDFSGCL